MTLKRFQQKFDSEQACREHLFQIRIFLGKRIYLIVIEACEKGLELLSDLNLQKIIYWEKHRKAFEKDYIFNEHDLVSAKETIRFYETMVTDNDCDYIFGYDGSEALMAFYYDTPDNTLSTFCYENHEIEWHPPFPRRNTINPSWMHNFANKQIHKIDILREKKKIMQRVKYSLAISKNKEKGR